MSPTRKLLILALLAAILLGLLALAASLPRLDLQQGQAFRLPEQAEITKILDEEQAGGRTFLALRIIIAVFIIFYPIYILISLLTKQGRRRLVNDFIRLAILGTLLLLLNRRVTPQEELPYPEVTPAALLLGTPNPNLPLSVFEDPTPPWAPTGILIFGAVLLAALAGAIAWWWFVPERAGGSASLSTQEQLADQAGQAAQAIADGEDLQDVILRTYYRMERILSEERGVDRPQAMTPSEFAEALAGQGLPQGAVADLTHLFEAVRYGHVQSGPEMQQRAVNALRAIEMLLPPNLILLHKPAT
jgi:hypothetical protein